jgi:hypothetical protein
MIHQSPGQMTWRPNGSISCGTLHLRLRSYEPWQPYTAFPQYVLPDPPGFSQGYSTFRSLLEQKWQVL